MAVNSAGRKPQEIPLREAAGRDKSAAPSRMMQAKAMAIIFMALKLLGRFFIQKANEFKSSIWVEREERRVNAKSLLGVLSLGIVKGTAVTIIADGVDDDAAIATLAELIDSDFTE